MVRLLIVFAVLLCGCQQSSSSVTPTIPDNAPPNNVATKTETKSIEDAVSIEFPESANSYSVKEAAKGIEISYEVVVDNDVANVLPLSQRSQSNLRIDYTAPRLFKSANSIRLLGCLAMTSSMASLVLDALHHQGLFRQLL